MNKKNGLASRLISFITHDIWRITEEELSKTQKILYSLIRVITLSVRYFINERLNVKASALTFSILFAMVPMIALIIAIGRGLGVEKNIELSLNTSFEAHSSLIPIIMDFVRKYLETTQGGLFIGIGIVVLLVSVMNFFIQVELAFNEIWQVKKQRSAVNRFTMYFSAMLVIPIFIILTSGVSIFVNTIFTKTSAFEILTPFMRFGIKATPYLLNWIVFTVMYRAIPNTKVNLKDAAIAGIIAGTAFQVFQILYISGQVYLSRYNVVYGSFAAIPLLLLWLQISCLIVLLGADIAYASQNRKNYEFENDSKNISIRYKNFLILYITWLIVKQFENQQPPLSAGKIAEDNKFPIRLTNQLLSNLTEANVLIEVFNEGERDKTYQPAIDINQLSIGLLFEKMENYGSKHFLENKNTTLDEFWKRTHANEDFNKGINDEILIKNI